MNQLPPEPKPDELSVREKAVEVATGVFVTKMRTRAIRLGGQVVPAVELAGLSGIHGRRPATAEQAVLFRIAAQPMAPEYSLDNTEPDNGFTTEQQAEIKEMTAADDAARAAGEDIIDAYHRTGGIS